MTSRDEEDALFRNVLDLRKKLQQTQASLQNLNAVHLGNDGPTNASSNKTSPERVAPLTLDDLTPPELPPRDRSTAFISQRVVTERVISSSPKRFSSASHEQNASQKVASSHEKAGLDSSSSYDVVMNAESKTLRQRLLLVREENDMLVAQNHKLLNQMEAMGLQIHQSTNKVQYLTSDVKEYKKQVSELKDRLAHLEKEYNNQDHEFRQMEDRYEESQLHVADMEGENERHREEIDNLKADLEHEIAVRQRVEDERDTALQNIEELQQTNDAYQQKTKDKLKKHHNQEEHLRENLEHANSERQELLSSNTELQQQIEVFHAQIRRLQEDNQIERETRNELEQFNLSMKSQISQHLKTIGKGEIEVRNFKQENESLKVKVKEQEEQIILCQRLVGESQAQLMHLESVAQRLQHERANIRMETDSGVSMSKPLSSTPNHDENLNEQDLDGSYLDTLKEKTPGRANSKEKDDVIEQLRSALAEKETLLQDFRAQADVPAKPSPSVAVENLKKELQSVIERNKIGEQRLEDHEKKLSEVEEERRRFMMQVMSLEETLQDSEVTISSLEARLTQRQGQLAELQKDISEKDARLNVLEREVRKRTSQISSLEGQLDDKVGEVTEQVSRVTELEEELMMMSSQLQKVTADLEEKRRSYTQNDAMVEKMKQLHAEQCQEMERHMELMEQKLERKDGQLAEAEKQHGILQQEIDIKSAAYDEARKELELHSQQTQNAITTLERQAGEATERVKQLEASLVVCREELTMHLEQLDDMKDQHERQLMERNEKMHCMEGEIRQLQEVIDEKEGQITLLEAAIDERQQMLQESTNRIGELEDGQNALEGAVTRLEHELQRQKSNWDEDVNGMESKLKQSCVELEHRMDQVQELNNQIRDLASDKKRLSDEVHALERKLGKMRKDAENKSAHIVTLEADVRDLNTQLNEKSDSIEDLEEQMHSIEYDLQDRQEKVTKLDSQLKTTQGDLQSTKRHLMEVEDDYDHARGELAKKQELIDSLRDSLRCSQDELRSRNRELEEMDKTLKQRGWEIQQRAQQLTQLDLHIKDHRSEMEQRVIQLEEVCQKAQQDLKHKDTKITDLNKQLSELEEVLLEKSRRIQHSENVNQGHQKELVNCTEKMAQLERHLDGMQQQVDSATTDNIQLTQQIRSAREEQHRSHVELTESKKELAIALREQERLKRELEDLRQISKGKESDADRLAEELGNMKASESQMEVRYTAEIRKLQREVETMKEKHDREMADSEDSTSKALSSKEEQVTQMRKWLEGAKEREEQLLGELEGVKTRVVSLESDLRASRDSLMAAREAMVLKESQLTRAMTRISGLERAAMMAAESMGRQAARRSPRESNNEQKSVLSVSGFSQSQTAFSRATSLPPGGQQPLSSGPAPHINNSSHSGGSQSLTALDEFYNTRTSDHSRHDDHDLTELSIVHQQQERITQNGAHSNDLDYLGWPSNEESFTDYRIATQTSKFQSSPSHPLSAEELSFLGVSPPNAVAGRQNDISSNIVCDQNANTLQLSLKPWNDNDDDTFKQNLGTVTGTQSNSVENSFKEQLIIERRVNAIYGEQSAAGSLDLPLVRKTDDQILAEADEIIKGSSSSGVEENVHIGKLISLTPPGVSEEPDADSLLSMWKEVKQMYSKPEAAYEESNLAKTHTSLVRSEAGAARTQSLSPTGEHKPSSSSSIPRGHSVPRVKSPLSSSIPQSSSGSAVVKMKVPLPYRNGQTKSFTETTVSKGSKQTVSKINKNSSKVVKPSANKSLASQKGPVPSTSTSKGFGSSTLPRAKSKEAKSPEFPSRQSIPSQYELVFGGESSKSERQSRFHQKCSSSSSSKGSTQMGGASGIRALGAELMSQMSKLSMQKDNHPSLLQTNDGDSDD